MKANMNKVKGTVWFSFCFLVAAMCLSAVFLPAQSGGITANDQKAQDAIDTAIKALGGADKISDIKSLIITGSVIDTIKTDPRVAKSGIITSKAEIRILLPDNMIRMSRDDNGDYHRGYMGLFRGEITSSNDTIKNLTGVSKVIRTWKEIITASHDLVGILMMSGPTPLRLSSSSKSGVFNLIMPAGNISDIGEIEFDSKTGYPSVIRYNESIDFGSGAPEIEIKFSSDRFPVNGIMFPRVITHASRTTTFSLDTISELRIDEVLINPKLSLKDFENPKY